MKKISSDVIFNRHRFIKESAKFKERILSATSSKLLNRDDHINSRLSVYPQSMKQQS